MIDLNPHHLDTVKRILAEHLPGCEVRAFGSRATWTAKEHSDLDLVVVGAKPLDWNRQCLVREAFEESDLPIRVDVVDWESLSEGFRQAIDGDCVVLQEAATSSDWRETTLGEVVHINPKRALKRGIEAPFVAMADVLENQRELQDLGTRDFKSSGSRFRNGDTLLARITPCLENGKTAWVSGLADDEVGHGSTEFIVLSAKDGVTDPRFVYYLARHPKFRSYAIGQMTGTSGRQRVPVSAIESYELSLPPLDEQQRIAGILGALDDKIELNRRMCQTLEAMAQALFKSWFVDFDPVRAKANGQPTNLPPEIDALFPDSLQDSELGEIPEGWEVGKLGDSFNLTMGQSPPGSTYNDDGDGLPFFQGSTDFGFRYPTNRKFCSAPKRIANQGDTLISVRAPVGDINMAWEDCCIGRGVAALRHKSGSFSYTYHAVQALRERLKSYDDNGTVFGAINKGQLDALTLIDPPTTLVEAFVFPFDERLAAATADKREVEQLRDYLLPNLLGSTTV